MLRLVLIGAAGIAVLAGSFFTTLWALDQFAPTSDRITALAKAPVSDEASLRTAANAAGLKISTDVALLVDSLARPNSAGNARIAGWTLENTPAGIARGKPNTIMVFSEGLNLATFESSGERPDVAAAYKLSGPITGVLAYSVTLACAPGAKVVATAITVTGLYSAPYAGTCP